jgi:hypothetical protein
MRAHADRFSQLRLLLREAFQSRAEGAGQPRLARAQGYADGYMRALLDDGRATPAELLAVVAEERARIGGPATREVATEPAVA